MGIMKGTGGLDTFSSTNKYFGAFLDKVLSSFFVLKYWVLSPALVNFNYLGLTNHNRTCPCVTVIGGLGYIATWQSSWAVAMF